MKKQTKNPRNQEPKLIIPEGIGHDMPGASTLVYLPFPNTVDQGKYIDRFDLVKLLRANKNNPAAIQYIADMLE